MTPLLPLTLDVECNDGETRTLELTGDWRRDITAALELDHPHDPSYIDRGSDIAVALDEGFPLTAAYLLTGATETPALSAVQGAYADSVGIPEDGALIDFPASERDGWFDFHDRMARRCEACNGTTYAAVMEEPETCAQCGKSLMRDYVILVAHHVRSNRNANDTYEDFDPSDADPDDVLYQSSTYEITSEQAQDPDFSTRLYYGTRELPAALPFDEEN